MSALSIYLLFQVDELRDVAGWGLATITVSSIITLMVWFLTDFVTSIKKLFSYLKWPLILSLFVLAFVPNTKTLIAMTTIPEIMQNEDIKALPDDVLKCLRGIIREYTPKEVTPQK